MCIEARWNVPFLGFKIPFRLNAMQCPNLNPLEKMDAAEALRHLCKKLANTNLSEQVRTEAEFPYKITRDVISITDTGFGATLGERSGQKPLCGTANSRSV